MDGRPRRYGQFCGLARALDVIGDRWTLLMVRELLLGPRRFGELRDGLCGVATNLLSQRLRHLEAEGLIERRLSEPGEGTRYALTPRGEELRAVIDALVRWSAPLMASGRGDDAFRPDWLAVALPALVREGPPSPVRVRLETADAVLAIDVGRDGACVGSERDVAASATLRASPELVLGLASGALDVSDVLAAGGQVAGDRESLERAFRGSTSSKNHGGRP